jgi:hypothetical protein
MKKYEVYLLIVATLIVVYFITRITIKNLK